MARRKDQQTIQYLQVTPGLWEQISKQNGQKKERSEPGHMTQYFWWPVMMSIGFPLLIAVPLTLLYIVMYWAGSFFWHPSGRWPSWQSALILFVIAYCLDVLAAAKVWTKFVVNQWAGVKTLTEMQNTTVVKHERSEPHVVPLNTRGDKRSLGEKFQEIRENLPIIGNRAGEDAPPQIDKWIQDEYDALMTIWPDNQKFTRETFKPLPGWQAKYTKYTARWESLNLIERIGTRGGWRFVVSLDTVFDKLPELLPCSEVAERQNDDRGTN